MHQPVLRVPKIITFFKKKYLTGNKPAGVAEESSTSEGIFDFAHTSDQAFTVTELLS